MEKITFTFEETNEDVVFAILDNVQYKEIAYLLVVDEQELGHDDLTAYVIKAVEIAGDEVIYEIVDNDDELSKVMPLFKDVFDSFDIED